MAHNVCGTCKKADWVIDGGYVTCRSCGQVLAKELDENHCAYSETPTHSITPTYTRMKRFRCKILGGLQRRLYHTLDTGVLELLRKRFTHLVPPEIFVDHLLSLDVGRRKPYIHITYYYEAVFGITLPYIPAHEEALINRIFKEIFFASDRLQLPSPTFPMSSLLRLIVDHFEFSVATQTVVRFARRLRCRRRRRRYRKMFIRCTRYIYNNERTCDAFCGIRMRPYPMDKGGAGEATSYSLPACLSEPRGG